MVLFGPPGSGKGTQAAKIAEKYNMTQISTGNLLREEITNKTKLGLEVKNLVHQGSLVPDDIIINIISKHISHNLKNNIGHIFDGFPRTIEQAKQLDQLLSECNSSISVVVSLIVSDNDIKKRLINRGKELNRKDDASIEIIDNRIKEYYSKTLQVSKFYKNQGKLFEINGNDNIDAVFNNVVNIINQKYED